MNIKAFPSFHTLLFPSFFFMRKNAEESFNFKQCFAKFVLYSQFNR